MTTASKAYDRGRKFFSGTGMAGAKIVFDCRMANESAMMSPAIPVKTMTAGEPDKEIGQIEAEIDCMIHVSAGDSKDFDPFSAAFVGAVPSKGPEIYCKLQSNSSWASWSCCSRVKGLTVGSA